MLVKDAIRDAFTSGMVKSHIPIMYDDMSVEQASGGMSRSGLPVESLKLLLEVMLNKVPHNTSNTGYTQHGYIAVKKVQQSTSLAARFKDFSLAANMPRLFTTNAANPHEFHNALPVDPWGITNAARVALCRNVKAAFKRSCFAQVTHCVVPSDIRQSHNKSRRLAQAGDA